MRAARCYVCDLDVFSASSIGAGPPLCEAHRPRNRPDVAPPRYEERPAKALAPSADEPLDLLDPDADTQPIPFLAVSTGRNEGDADLTDGGRTIS